MRSLIYNTIAAIFFGSFVAAPPAIAVPPAVAQAHLLRVGLDLDVDDTTGCTLEGADASGAQTATGLEWSVALSIDPTGTPPTITEVRSFTCDDVESWGTPSDALTTGWAIGTGNGESSGDVVEFQVETGAFELSEQTRFFVFAESAGGHRDTLFTLDGTSSTNAIFFPRTPVLPALSPAALLALVLLLATCGLFLFRSSRPILILWFALVGLASAQVAWALTLSLDGDVSDWSGVWALAIDAAEDSETNDPSADILALFVDWDDSDLAVRVDIADLEADLCEHGGTTCAYVSDSGDNANSGALESPWETLGFAVTQLSAGDRLLIYAGEYRETERIIVSEDGVQILGEDDVLLHNTIDLFKTSGGWINAGDLSVPGVYVSTSSFAESDADEAVTRAWGTFQLGSSSNTEDFMLISYECYQALAATHHFYPTALEDCTTWPYIGPGVYWDKDGVVDSSRVGHIYVRMESGPEQFDAVMGEKISENLWSFSLDASDPNNPNDIAMKVTLGGPFLQLNADNVSVRNLKLEHGSFRMGGSSVGNSLREVTFDGPAYESPIEFYSGGSEHILEELQIDEKFPHWVTWNDTKEIFQEVLMYAAITLNTHDPNDTTLMPIHDITLLNSTIQNVHDGLELNNDDYHHLYVMGNLFHNVQDDGVQLGSDTYDVEIAQNTFTEVGTSISRHGHGANSNPGRKYIHHNFIDASTPKYFCRENSADTECSGDGIQTLRAFNVHDGSGWEEDGDPRYYYNNTVVVNGDILGIGLHGQEYQDRCTGGANGGFNWVSGDFPCDTDDAAPDDTCNLICVRGPDPNSPSLDTCGSDSDCDSSTFTDGVCASGAVCTSHSLPYGQPSLVFNNVFVQLDPNKQITTQSPKWSILAPPTLILNGNLYYRPTIASPTEEPFEMSGTSCDFDLYREELCVSSAGDPEGWTPQISPEWEFSDAEYSFGIETAGLFDDTDLDLTTYVPNCSWLEGKDAPVDLTAIDGAYTVTTTDSSAPDDFWTFALERPLPGVDGDYRGHTTCQ